MFNFSVFFFNESVIGVWNCLPESINFSSLDSFIHTIKLVDLSQFLNVLLVIL